MYPSDPTPPQPSTPRPFDSSHALELADLYSEAEGLRRDRTHARILVAFLLVCAMFASAQRAGLQAQVERLTAELAARPAEEPCQVRPFIGCYGLGVWTYGPGPYGPACIFAP